MSRAVRHKKHLTTLQIFLSIVLILLTACVAVKAFFLKAPEQKVDELPSQSASAGDPQLSEEEQAAQEALGPIWSARAAFTPFWSPALTMATATATLIF